MAKATQTAAERKRSNYEKYRRFAEKRAKEKLARRDAVIQRIMASPLGVIEKQHALLRTGYSDVLHLLDIEESMTDPVPTNVPPGPERVEVLARRYASNQRLWHDDDNNCYGKDNDK